MTEGEKQLRLEHSQLQDKRFYFLLAAAGTSIGFAVTQIDAQHASKYLYLLLLALVCLGVSFLSGIKVLSVKSKLLSANSVYLQEIPNAQSAGYSPTDFRELADQKSFNPLAKKMSFWTESQIWFLFAGGCLIPAWKIMSCEECVTALMLNICKVTSCQH